MRRAAPGRHGRHPGPAFLHPGRYRDSDGRLPSVFTADAHLTFPFGEYRGMSGLIGGHYEATAILAPEGRRFRRLVFDLVWNAGLLPWGRPGEAGQDHAGQA